MRRVIFLLPGLLLATAASANADTKSDEAREILKQARDALTKVTLVAYDFDYKGTGGLEPRGRAVSGKTVLGLPSEEKVDRFRCQVEIEDPSSLRPIKVTVGGDGNEFFFTDHKRKTVYQDLDPAVLGRRGARIQQLLRREFISEEPLKDEIAAEKLELRDSQSIGGEDCFQVYIEQSRPPHIVWFISKKDFLPRCIKRPVVLPGETTEWGSWQYTMTNLVINPKFTSDPFAITIPDGYTKSDDYAP